MPPRYIIFAGSSYYPVGGWEDYHSSHQTKAEAEVETKSIHKDYWWHIVDIAEGKIIRDQSSEL